MNHDTHKSMSNPGMVLAVHNTRHGHSVTWTRLEDGRVLMCGANQFSYSEDGGDCWSEPFSAKDAGGNEVTGFSSLLPLKRGAIGAVCTTRPQTNRNRYGAKLLFRRSDDAGQTWSDPMPINSELSVHPLQDSAFRTSSGRLIVPAYTSLGQGGFHAEGEPFVGGYINGNFVSTDAHFYDSHFSATTVYYSDDEGTTWQRNEDGELFIWEADTDQCSGAAEPSVCEVKPGKLLMIVRTRLGRYFQAWSNDDGATWTRLQPTQLSGTQAPAQVRRLGNGHLLCVFTQQSREEIRKGFIRTRLSSAVSRNDGGVWELFQNIESIHDQTHVEPGPIGPVRPEGRYAMTESAAIECETSHVVPLPVGYGRWSYPSVLVLDDRVLISHTFSQYDQTGTPVDLGFNSKLKVLPTKWFYGGQDPDQPRPILDKLSEAARP